jgi:hypothetical protein
MARGAPVRPIRTLHGSAALPVQLINFFGQPTPNSAVRFCRNAYFARVGHRSKPIFAFF